MFCTQTRVKNYQNHFILVNLAVNCQREARALPEDLQMTEYAHFCQFCQGVLKLYNNDAPLFELYVRGVRFL